MQSPAGLKADDRIKAVVSRVKGDPDHEPMPAYNSQAYAQESDREYNSPEKMLMEQHLQMQRNRHQYQQPSDSEDQRDLANMHWDIERGQPSFAIRDRSPVDSIQRRPKRFADYPGAIGGLRQPGRGQQPTKHLLMAG